TARPGVVSEHLVHRKRMIDGIAQRGNYPAVRNMRLDAVGCQRIEQVRTDLDDLALAGCVAKVARVPVDALVVVVAEKLGLLDPIRQIDVTFEHAMEPGSAAAPGAGADNLGKPRRTRSSYCAWFRVQRLLPDDGLPTRPASASPL